MAYIGCMIHGYGYERDPDDLRAQGAEKLWVDTAKSDRQERTDLINVAMRRGDEIVILARGDLGHGREIPMIEAMIAERGVTVRVADVPKPAPLPPGPAPSFRPTYEQERRLRHYWHGPFRARDALAQACDIMGRPDTEIERARMRNALNKHLGTRRAPKPWINTPAKEHPGNPAARPATA